MLHNSCIDAPSATNAWFSSRKSFCFCTIPPSPRPPLPPKRASLTSDQGFLNSFYPYFAACPAFEPYPTYGSMLAGPSNGPDTLRVRLDGSVEIFGEKRVAADALSWKGSRNARDGDGTRGRGLSRVGGGGQDTRGCKRLPTRYNGDWPLLFVDGDLQVCFFKVIFLCPSR